MRYDNTIHVQYLNQIRGHHEETHCPAHRFGACSSTCVVWCRITSYSILVYAIPFHSIGYDGLVAVVLANQKSVFKLLLTNLDFDIINPGPGQFFRHVLVVTMAAIHKYRIWIRIPWFNSQWVSIRSGNGLAPIRRQTTPCTNDDPFTGA